MRYTGAASGPGLPNGLQYNRARFYSPTQHRFISQDPISFAGGDTNLYRYAGGDPVDNTDPSGTFVGLAIACAAGGLINDIGGALIGTKHDLGDYISGGAKGCAVGAVATFNPELAPETLADAPATLATEETAATEEGTGAAEEGTAAATEEPAAAAEDAVPAIKAGSAEGETAGKAFPQSVR